MAQLLATQMLDWRTRNAKLYENEFRGTNCGALEFYVSQNSVPGGPVNRELLALAQRSMGNTIKFPVLKRNTTATVATTRTCTAENHETESALQTISWLVARDSFMFFPNRYMNNDIQAQEHFDANMRDMINRLRKKLEDYCLADLNTNKTQVFNDNFGYTVSSNVIQALGIDRHDLLIDVEGMMRANNYDAPLHIIGTPGILNLYQHLAEHGLYNDVNRRYEYEDKVLHVSNSLDHTNKFAAFYAVTEGQVGFVSRLSRAQYNNDSANGTEWGSIVLPGTGINFGVTKKIITGDMTSYLDSSCADMTCDYGEQYIFEAEIAFVDKYNSAIASFANPIIKCEIGQFNRGVNAVTEIVPATGAVFNTASTVTPATGASFATTAAVTGSATITPSTDAVFRTQEQTTTASE